MHLVGFEAALRDLGVLVSPPAASASSSSSSSRSSSSSSSSSFKDRGGGVSGGASSVPAPGLTIRFVKLDCEGCEYSVLTATPELWRNHVGFVAGEFHDLCKKVNSFCHHQELSGMFA